MTALNSRPVNVKRNWMKLEDTPYGCVIQQLSGVPVYFYYSVAPPAFDAVGHIANARGGLNEFPGGTIWCRCDGDAVIVYTPYDVDHGNGGHDSSHDGGGGSGSLFESYDITITQEMLNNKALTLAHDAPIANFSLGVYSGLPQRNNVDYELTGNVVSWGTLALELLLDTNTVVFVQYTR